MRRRRRSDRARCRIGAGRAADGDAAHRKVTPAELAIYASAGLLRLALAQKYAERHGIFKKTGDAAKDFRFLWVTNFPMFEWDEGEKQWMAAHHPFTSPHEEDMTLLEAGRRFGERSAVDAERGARPGL